MNRKPSNKDGFFITNGNDMSTVEGEVVFFLFFVLFDINLPENFSTPELCLKGNVQNSQSQMSYYIITVHTYIHFPGFHDIGYVIFYRYTVQKLS